MNRDLDGGRGGHGHYGGRGSRGSHRSRGRGGFGSFDGGQSRFKKSYSEEVRDQVEMIYNKKFKFSDEYDQWKLPEYSDWFNQVDKEPFQVEGLLEIKKKLNELKSRLDEVEPVSWSRHTHFTNRSGIVVPAVRRDFEPEMCTQVGVWMWMRCMVHCAWIGVSLHCECVGRIHRLLKLEYPKVLFSDYECIGMDKIA